MKIKKLITGAILATTLAIGVGVGVATLANKKVEAEPVSAGTHTQNPTIYFVPSDNWAEANATFKMNCYDSGTWKGKIDMTLVGTSTVPGPYYNRKVFKGVVTGGWWINQIQILRLNSDGSQQWNYSGNVTLTDSNSSPMLMVRNDVVLSNDWTESADGVWWTSIVQHGVYKTTDQSPSSSTGRVFFYNSGTHWVGNCGVYAWGGSTSKTIWSGQSYKTDACIYYFSWFTDDNGDSYGFADIPTDVTGYKIVKLTDDNSYYTGTSYFSTTEFVADSFAYVRYGQKEGNAISTGGAHGDVAGANLMKKVIQAYDTCSSSVLNGYGAYGALNTNFYSHATAAAKSATETSLNGNSATIQAHFEGMQYRSTNGSSVARVVLFGNDPAKTSSIAVVIIATVIAATAVGGYFFLRRRKEN